MSVCFNSDLKNRLLLSTGHAVFVAAAALLQATQIGNIGIGQGLHFQQFFRIAGAQQGGIQGVVEVGIWVELTNKLSLEILFFGSLSPLTPGETQLF